MIKVFDLCRNKLLHVAKHAIIYETILHVFSPKKERKVTKNFMLKEKVTKRKGF